MRSRSPAAVSHTRSKALLVRKRENYMLTLRGETLASGM